MPATPKQTKMKHFIAYIVTFLVILSTKGQNTGSGRITGKVYDSTTSLTLAGVSIAVKGTNKGVTSIADGSYILGVSPGTYIIRFSYTGYAPKETPVITVKKGETIQLDIILSPQANQLKDVVVTASRGRTATSAALNIQRNSQATANVIGADVIAKTPDNNAGQILKRVSGLNVQNDRFVVVRGLNAQYNLTMLNGVLMTSTESNQNAFSFDLIPSSSIENIVVNKTATPDMPGNFAGGIVQINTRDFPARDFISVSAGTGYSDQTIGKSFFTDKPGKLEWLAFGGNDRDLPQGYPRNTSRVNIVTLNEQERVKWLRQLKNNISPVDLGKVGSSFPTMNNTFQLGFGKTIRFKNNSQFGIIGGISQRKNLVVETDTVSRGITGGTIDPSTKKTTSTGSLFAIDRRNEYSSDLNGFINFAYSFGNNKITAKTILSKSFRKTFVERDSFLLEELFFYNEGPHYGLNHTIEERMLANNTLAGEHKTGRNRETIITWNINATTTRSEYPDTRIFAFARKDSLYNTLDLGVRTEDLVSRRSRSWSSLKDLTTGGAFNITTVYKIKNVKQIFKGGILIQNRRRLSQGDLLPFQFDALQDLAIDSFFAPSSFLSIPVNVGDVANAFNFTANSSLQAIYESMENKIGKNLRVIWGVRLEYYQQASATIKNQYFNGIRLPENTLTTNKFASNATLNFLPSINAVYSPFTNSNIRGAFYKTVLRPDLRDIVATSIFDYRAYRFITGNASLQSSSITNAEFKFEYFPSASELLSAGVFSKKIINPIEYGEATATNNTVGRLAINSGDALVQGIELELRKKIDFIKAADWLKNLTLFGNLTLMKSNVKERYYNINVFPYSPPHRLTGQANYIINAGLNISAFKGNFDFTLNFNKTGDNIDQLGSSEYQRAVPDLEAAYGRKILLVENFWLKPRNLVDLTLRQSFIKGKGLIKFSVANLLAEPTIIYWDINGNQKYDNIPFNRILRPNNLASPGSTMDGSIDHITSQVTGQRVFSFSISYTF